MKAGQWHTLRGDGRPTLNKGAEVWWASGGTLGCVCGQGMDPAQAAGLKEAEACQSQGGGHQSPGWSLVEKGKAREEGKKDGMEDE